MKLKIHIIMFDIGVNNQTFEIPLYSSMLYIYMCRSLSKGGTERIVTPYR